jgi:ribosome modulation factor
MEKKSYFADGYDAYLDNMPEDSCPCEYGPDEREDWEAGWWAARSDELDGYDYDDYSTLDEDDEEEQK